MRGLPRSKNSWQSNLFETLRDRQWHVLGELFEAIETTIPSHFAMRYVMSLDPDQEMPCVMQARWQMFCSRLPMIGVEFETPRRFGKKWSDRVRLKYVDGRSCDVCLGPVIKAGWSASSNVACLACEAAAKLPPAPPVPEPLPPAEPPPRPDPVPSPQLPALVKSPPPPPLPPMPAISSLPPLTFVYRNGIEPQIMLRGELFLTPPDDEQVTRGIARWLGEHWLSGVNKRRIEQDLRSGAGINPLLAAHGRRIRSFDQIRRMAEKVARRLWRRQVVDESMRAAVRPP